MESNFKLFLILWFFSFFIILGTKFLIVNHYMLKQVFSKKQFLIDTFFYFLSTSSLLILSSLGPQEMEYEEIQLFVILVYPILLIMARYYLYKKNSIYHLSQYDWGLWYLGIILFLMSQFGMIYALGYLF